MFAKKCRQSKRRFVQVRSSVGGAIEVFSPPFDYTGQLLEILAFAFAEEKTQDNPNWLWED